MGNMPRKTARKKQPVKVEGYTIAVSTLAMVAMMTVSAILFVAGVALIVAYFAQADFSIWALILGVAMFVIGPAGVGVGIHQLRVKERLILGSDCFQVIHQIQGADEVITQIPYANIATITFERGTQRNYVGIDLVELNEPNTHDSKNRFETNKSVRSFHWIIDPGYTEGLETIYEMLRERVEHYQAAHGQ